MTSKTWSSGTIIDSAWLQDVNDYCYNTHVEQDGVPQSWEPAFGVMKLHVWDTWSSGSGLSNAIVGSVLNDAPSGTVIFPTGVTGLGRNNSEGNTAFGMYAEIRQHANTGCGVGAELDSFNFGAAPTNVTRPDRSIGTTQQLPNAVTVGAGGSANSWCGIHFVREGSSPQKFLYGAIFAENAVTESAIVVEATATDGPTLPVLVKHKASSIALQLQNAGITVNNNSVFQTSDSSGTVQFSVRQNGRLGFTSGITQTTVGAAGGATALPATPTGYLKFLVGATEYVLPYYAVS